eukprot:6192334-Pleurochrysis_carterae.AAC.1
MHTRVLRCFPHFQINVSVNGQQFHTALDESGAPLQLPLQSYCAPETTIVEQSSGLMRSHGDRGPPRPFSNCLWLIRSQTINARITLQARAKTHCALAFLRSLAEAYLATGPGLCLMARAALPPSLPLVLPNYTLGIAKSPFADRATAPLELHFVCLCLSIDGHRRRGRAYAALSVYLDTARARVVQILPSTRLENVGLEYVEVYDGERLAPSALRLRWPLSYAEADGPLPDVLTSTTSAMLVRFRCGGLSQTTRFEARCDADASTRHVQCDVNSLRNFS